MEFDFDEIPGLKEAGWTQQAYEQAKEGEEKTFEEQCQEILKIVHRNDNSWPFREPVDPKKVPDYYDIIKEPMDLLKIQNNLEESHYTSRE